MMNDLPIMCTLTPNKMVDRLTDFEALFATSLTGMEREPLRLRLTFDAGADAARVRELFEAEQQCCAFLAFSYENTETGLAVSIAAPPDAEPTLDGFETLARRNASPETVADGWTG
ncbi:hypothetical protein AB0F17_53730 [Nonomuraea sp. NPDC026600]|uniref:hypothetical protein n=1 Tax=Nonomuraea sp. NPDC026600 TaxID=3155363 RepID=UPI0033FA2F45